MIELTWYGNATILFRAGETSLISDPFFTRNPDLPPITMEEIAQADGILVTHGHFDHVADFPAILDELPHPVLAPPAVAPRLQHWTDALAKHTVPMPTNMESPFQDVTLTALDAKHVTFDLPLIVSTVSAFFKGDVGLNWTRLKRNLYDHRHCPMGQCVAWLLEYQGSKALHIGSLALDPGQVYPTGVDVLCLPLQGNSKVHELAADIVEKLQPKAVYIHHIDDAFPPISQNVDTAPFVELMAARYPEIPVTIPEYRLPVTFGN